jgi:hypothetical protein
MLMLAYFNKKNSLTPSVYLFIGLAYQEGKDIVFRFIIEYYSSLRDLSP